MALTLQDLGQGGWQCRAVEDSVANSSDLRRWDAEQRVAPWGGRLRQFSGASYSFEEMGSQDTSA